MFTSLVTLEDGWQLVCQQGILRYRYTATGHPMVNLQSYKAAIDHAGHLHIVVTLLEGRLIYARWQGQRWESSGLPVAGTLLALVLDSLGQPHLLLTGPTGSATRHLYRDDANHWRQQVLPFHLDGQPLLLKPLSQGRIFLAGQEVNNGRRRVLVTVYNPTTAWKVPRIVQDTEPARQRYGYWYQGHLYLLSWAQQESGFRLHLRVVNPDGAILSSLSPGAINDLPDDQPVLVGQGNTRLFIWTASNRMAYCFSQDNGYSWSSPQSAYFFFPARIKRVEGPDGPSTRQVAFTKISGLEPDWPLVINFEPLFSLCKAVLVQRADGNSPWKQ